MTQKIQLLLGSIRFWEVTLATLSQIAKIYFPAHSVLWDILTVYLGVVVSIGTADSIATKIGVAK